MPLLTHNFSANLPKILASKLKFDVNNYMFWGQFAKFTTPHGRPARDVQEVKTTDSPVVIHHELSKEPGDRIRIPIMRRLVNRPTIGMNQLQGRGEQQAMNFAEVWIDILRHAVQPKVGSMSVQTTKDFNLIQNSYPQLRDHYAQVENFAQASWSMYYGTSENVMNSNRINPIQITGYIGGNMRSISHPVIFGVNNGQIATAVPNQPGTLGYETNVAAMINNLVPVDVINTRVLSALRYQPAIRRIKPIVTDDGLQLIGMACHPHQLATLEADPNFATVQQAAFAQAYAKKNPYLYNVKYIYAGFALFDAGDSVFQAWVGADGRPVWGPGWNVGGTTVRSYNNLTVFSTPNLLVNPVYGAIIFGENALVKAVAQNMEFDTAYQDFQEIQEIAYRIIEGWARPDYYNYDDPLNPIGSVLLNDTSALLLSWATQPTV